MAVGVGDKIVGSGATVVGCGEGLLRKMTGFRKVAFKNGQRRMGI